jgi:hypothetical protein
MLSTLHKRKTMFTLLFFLAIFFQNKFTLAQTNLLSLLPKNGETQTWNPTGSPEQAAGENLFLLINGGAEIYHEYGFKQVVMQEYQNNNQKSINVEIYEMNDAASAFGIYSFKTGMDGKSVAIGQDALLEDYYLNFWKGNFIVTLTGFDSEDETIDGITTIARGIDQKIIDKGAKPELTGALVTEGLEDHGVKYLKGNLALFNNSQFGSGDVFGLKEGVIGNYDKYKVFIFKYENDGESRKWFEYAEKNIIFDTRISSDKVTGILDYAILQKSEERIFLKLHQNYIIVVLGNASTDGAQIISNVQLKINDVHQQKE